MSVVIKDMKMPESCYYCGLADTSLINCQAFSPYKFLEDDCEERRPEWCPLVELPEHHGRLIDADEMRNLWTGCSINGSILPLIDARPTIVEAE